MINKDKIIFILTVPSCWCKARIFKQWRLMEIACIIKKVFKIQIWFNLEPNFCLKYSVTTSNNFFLWKSTFWRIQNNSFILKFSMQFLIFNNDFLKVLTVFNFSTLILFHKHRESQNFFLQKILLKFCVLKYCRNISFISLQAKRNMAAMWSKKFLCFFLASIENKNNNSLRTPSHFCQQYNII